MRVLIFHGYLLRGTGSNVYNANLGAALVRAGHEVHLFAQDQAPLELDWVDASATWDSGRLEVQTRREPVRATVYRPDIAGLLPVYVADRYAGIDARPFPELSRAEVERYIEANVAAVRELAARVRPDRALANHLVMGPVILARALAETTVPYAVKIHGSALEYTVKPHPRFRPYAREGLAGARGVLVGSRHTAQSLWKELDDDSLVRRTRLGPPGVDIERFAPREAEAASAGLRTLVGRLRGVNGAAAPAQAAAVPADPTNGETSAADLTNGETSAADEAAGALPRTEDPPSSFARDGAQSADALERLDLSRDRVVIFVGKLIGSKGVELLIAAWPLVLAAVPDAKLVIVGFGGFRVGLETLGATLAAGDLEQAAAIRSEDDAPLPWLQAFLTGLTGAHRQAYVTAAASSVESVLWTGRLEHDELHELLPVAEAMVVPSTFPESFGMVAAEAAACGALPIVARHSGLAEVAQALAKDVPREIAPLLSFAVGEESIPEIASALIGWLQAPDALRQSTRQALVKVVRERYSWDGVARTVVAAAAGELAALPLP